MRNIETTMKFCRLKSVSIIEKRTPKWKFSSQMDHSVILTQICLTLPLYTK